jgi:hypothetical protein
MMLDGLKRARNLFANFQSEPHRERTIAPDAFLQRFALHQFHRVKAFSVRTNAEAMDPGDIRMAQTGGSACFAEEASLRARMRGEIGVDHF